MWSGLQQSALAALGYPLLRVRRPGQAVPLTDAGLNAGLLAALARAAGPHVEQLRCPPALQGGALKRALWQQLRDLRRAR